MAANSAIITLDFPQYVRLPNVAFPIDLSDAATKEYVDQHTPSFAGISITSGNTVPSAGVGSNGDIFILTSNTLSSSPFPYQSYLKTANAWVHNTGLEILAGSIASNVTDRMILTDISDVNIEPISFDLVSNLSSQVSSWSPVLNARLDTGLISVSFSNVSNTTLPFLQNIYREGKTFYSEGTTSSGLRSWTFPVSQVTTSANSITLVGNVNNLDPYVNSTLRLLANASVSLDGNFVTCTTSDPFQNFYRDSANHANNMLVRNASDTAWMYGPDYSTFTIDGITKDLFNQKGDIIVGTDTPAVPNVVPTGLDGFVLTANAASPTGVSWEYVTSNTNPIVIDLSGGTDEYYLDVLSSANTGVHIVKFNDETVNRIDTLDYDANTGNFTNNSGVTRTYSFDLSVAVVATTANNISEFDVWFERNGTGQTGNTSNYVGFQGGLSFNPKIPSSIASTNWSFVLNPGESIRALYYVDVNHELANTGTIAGQNELKTTKLVITEYVGNNKAAYPGGSYSSSVFSATSTSNSYPKLTNFIPGFDRVIENTTSLTVSSRGNTRNCIFTNNTGQTRSYIFNLQGTICNPNAATTYTETDIWFVKNPILSNPSDDVVASLANSRYGQIASSNAANPYGSTHTSSWIFSLEPGESVIPAAWWNSSSGVGLTSQWSGQIFGYTANNSSRLDIIEVTGTNVNNFNGDFQGRKGLQVLNPKQSTPVNWDIVDSSSCTSLVKKVINGQDCFYNQTSETRSYTVSYQNGMVFPSTANTIAFSYPQVTVAGNTQVQIYVPVGTPDTYIPVGYQLGLPYAANTYDYYTVTGWSNILPGNGLATATLNRPLDHTTIGGLAYRDGGAEVKYGSINSPSLPVESTAYIWFQKGSAGVDDANGRYGQISSIRTSNTVGEMLSSTISLELAPGDYFNTWAYSNNYARMSAGFGNYDNYGTRINITELSAPPAYLSGITAVTAGTGLQGGGVSGSVRLDVVPPTGNNIGGVKAGNNISIDANGSISAITTAGVFYNVTDVTTNAYSVLTTDQMLAVYYNGVVNLTLPEAINCLGVPIIIKDVLGLARVDSSHTININTINDDTIDGGNNVTIQAPYNSITVVGIANNVWGII